MKTVLILSFLTFNHHLITKLQCCENADPKKVYTCQDIHNIFTVEIKLIVALLEYRLIQIKHGLLEKYGLLENPDMIYKELEKAFQMYLELSELYMKAIQIGNYLLATDPKNGLCSIISSFKDRILQKIAIRSTEQEYRLIQKLENPDMLYKELEKAFQMYLELSELYMKAIQIGNYLLATDPKNGLCSIISSFKAKVFQQIAIGATEQEKEEVKSEFNRIAMRFNYLKKHTI